MSGANLPRRAPYRKILNITLVTLVTLMGLGLAILMNARFLFEAVSAACYQNGLLMNSYFLDLLIRGESAVLISAILAGTIVKEFSKASVNIKTGINLALLATIGSSLAYSITLLFNGYLCAT